jgi:hypothetical protein
MRDLLCIRHPQARQKKQICLECIRLRDRDAMTFLLPLLEMDHENRDRLEKMCRPRSPSGDWLEEESV